MRRISAPNFRSRPPLLSGIPIALDSRDNTAEMPKKRLIENPPRFIGHAPATIDWHLQWKRVGLGHPRPRFIGHAPATIDWHLQWKRVGLGHPRASPDRPSWQAGPRKFCR